ncbi:MAG: type II secretion system F family protein [Actinobacteria bacterium]|nr:type II secretion system F family protein [Actinomycetota bacterium]
MTARRALAALGVGGLAAALLALPALAAEPDEGGVAIREVSLEGFPEVRVTLSIEGAETATAETVELTEGGRPIDDFTIERLSEAGEPVDAVLVLDTSGSMKGEPLAAAIAAALQFVTELPEGEGLRVGIVTFADEPRVLHELTPDRAAVLQALGKLAAEGETSLYDAVVEASGMFAGAGQRNVIVLSDGGDTASEATLKGAVAAARAAEATLYTVGLRTGEFDVEALQTLADRTGGRYAPAGTADLSEVYAGLAGELSNQYVITYRSVLKSGGQVEIGVAAPSGADAALALFPKVAPPPSGAPTAEPPAPASPLLAGAWGLAVALGLSFLAAFLLLVMWLGARDRTRRDRELVRRMAARTDEDDEAGERERGLGAWLPEPVVQGAERVVAASGLGGRLTTRLERAGLPLRTGEFVAATGLAALVGAAVGFGLLGSAIFAGIIAAVGALVPPLLLARAVRKRNKRLHGQLADILMILASSLRAGHSFFQALDMVAKEIGEPGSTEFGRVVAEIRLGRPVDEAMNAMAERIGSDDFKWAVLGVNVQREVGGNLAEILDTVADTVRERDQIRRQIDVYSAEGRLSISILTALPFLVALYIAKVNPGYLNLLFSTRVGLVMLGTAGCLMAVGIAWMRKIVKIDV